ncbi:hypothetical protein QYF36_017227 [Acer negundo]|nr:hypothetical protein QYF36_017227 [Acer negundo]
MAANQGYMCYEYDKNFQKKKGLEEHNQISHPNNKHTCLLCLNLFHHIGELLSHQVEHADVIGTKKRHKKPKRQQHRGN